MSILFLCLNVCSLIKFSTYLYRYCNYVRYISDWAVNFPFCCLSIYLYLYSSFKNNWIYAMMFSAVDFCLSLSIIFFRNVLFYCYIGSSKGLFSPWASSSSIFWRDSINSSLIILNFSSNFSFDFYFNSVYRTSCTFYFYIFLWKV